MEINYKYYIIKFVHNHFKCKIQADNNIYHLVKEFIKRQNKGEAKSDKIHLEKIKSITKEQFDSSLLYDETYKLL